MSRQNIIVVGAGLFGAVATIVARRAGHRVTLVDDARPNSGSRPSACLIKPGWIAGLGDAGKRGMEVLRKNFKVQSLMFGIKPFGSAQVDHVHPSDILLGAMREANKVVVQKVARVNDDGSVSLTDGTTLVGDVVLVCAGVWAQDIVPHQLPEIRALAGAAFTFSGVAPSTINVWAPYKQIVAFSRDRGTTWAGDGSAILHKNWTPLRQEENLARCRGAALLGAELRETSFGLRPYVKGCPRGVLLRVERRVWVSTAGAKNGTVLAAAQADEFLRGIET